MGDREDGGQWMARVTVAPPPSSLDHHLLGPPSQLLSCSLSHRQEEGAERALMGVLHIPDADICL